MRFYRISGSIAGITQYYGNTSQVHLLVHHGDSIKETLPFYKFMGEEYIGKVVDFESTINDDGSIVQVIKGSNFKLNARASGSIRRNRRIVKGTLGKVKI